MGPEIERRPRGWSLTRRLVCALSIGAFFVAILLGFMGADRDNQRRTTAQEDAEQVAAESMAARSAPLLAEGDVMRLAVLASAVCDQFDGRVLIFDRNGRVMIDSALVLGDRKMSLLAGVAPSQRIRTNGDGSITRESLSVVSFEGETIGEVRLQVEPSNSTATFDLSWFGLALLSCLSLAVVAFLLAHQWASSVRRATDGLIRMAAGEVAGHIPDAAESELQDLGSAMRELERSMQDGIQRVSDGYLAMALRVVDGLEKRRLVLPGHGERTARLAARIAQRIKLLDADRKELMIACRLIDFGKASIRSSILVNEGQHTRAEARSLDHHPVHAAEQLECVPALRRVARILRHQLERYDGRGTPNGLRGDRLPLGSRILAIAASFDLLTTGAEGKPLHWTEALVQINKAKGEVFDPWLVELFVSEIERDPPEPTDSAVMMAPAGSLPWRRAEAGEEEELEDEPNVDLELLLDDLPCEDQ